MSTAPIVLTTMLYRLKPVMPAWPPALKISGRALRTMFTSGFSTSRNKKKGLADLKGEVAVQSAHNSETPLEYMLRIMRDPTQPTRRRDEMARAAAPFVHAKLMPEKMEPKDSHLLEMTSTELEAELVRKLKEWGYLPEFIERGWWLEPGERSGLINNDGRTRSRVRRLRDPPREVAS